jgi:hypothetical protein
MRSLCARHATLSAFVPGLALARRPPARDASGMAKPLSKPSRPGVGWRTTAVEDAMTLDEFISLVEDKSPPAPENELAAFETAIGQALPDDYRYFLANCNGGYLGGRFGINVVGGLRPEADYSLIENSNIYGDRIPASLMWIMDDPFGNAICLGLEGEHLGKVYHWDHENEPVGEDWDGDVETAGNVTLLANSFSEFVADLQDLNEA